MQKDDFIALCKKEFDTDDVVYEQENQVVVDKRFRIIGKDNGFLKIIDLTP